jgi:hypothetical protein
LAIREAIRYGDGDGLGTPGCGKVTTGLDGVYGGGVTGAYVGAEGGDTAPTGTGIYGAGDM